MDFREISYCVIFTKKICRERRSLFNIRQKITGILHADLRTFMTELITSVTLLVNKANLVHDFFLSIFILSVFILSMFIDLYMFRLTMHPSSGETTVFM